MAISRSRRKHPLIIATGALTTVSALSALVAHAGNDAHVPEKGDAERAALMDALRLDFYDGDAAAAHANDKGVVFKVLFLKVERGWACAHVDPLGGDGKKAAEARWAVLREEHGHWNDIHYFDALRPFASDEEADAALEMTPATVAKIRNKFPDAPVGIFP